LNEFLPWLIHLPLLGLLAYYFYRQSVGSILQSYFSPALGLKLLAGISLGLLYTYYYPYGGDTLVFFDDARLLAELHNRSVTDYWRVLLFDQFPDEQLPDFLVYEQEARSFFLIKILSVLSLLTFQNYWLCSLYFSLFSFCGMWLLANALAEAFPGSKGPAALAFLFFPSVVFWSAGVMKESLVMGIIGWVTAWWVQALLLQRQRKTGEFYLKAGFSLLLLLAVWKLKYYYFAVYLPCLLSATLLIIVSRKTNRVSPWLWAALVPVLFAVMAIIASQLHPNLDLNQFMAVMIQNHDTIYGLSEPGKRIEFDQLQPNLFSILRNWPLALVSGLFRPQAWEWASLLQGLNGLENGFLLILALLALLRLPKVRWHWRSPEETILLVTLLLYISLLASLLAFSTPNFGTLSRYKVAFLPFLVYLLSYFVGMGQPAKSRTVTDVRRS
jgi:hypothetical protein